MEHFLIPLEDFHTPPPKFSPTQLATFTYLCSSYRNVKFSPKQPVKGCHNCIGSRLLQDGNNNNNKKKNWGNKKFHPWEQRVKRTFSKWKFLAVAIYPHYQWPFWLALFQPPNPWPFTNNILVKRCTFSTEPSRWLNWCKVIKFLRLLTLWRIGRNYLICYHCDLLHPKTAAFPGYDHDGEVSLV